MKKIFLLLFTLEKLIVKQLVLSKIIKNFLEQMVI